MVRSLSFAALLVATVFALAGSAARCRAADATKANPFRVRFSPRVHHYDEKTDTFFHFKSTTVPTPRDAPGDDLGYYGNRLTQFRFIGPQKCAGIYGAMDTYKVKIKADPSHYLYRWSAHAP